MDAPTDLDALAEALREDGVVVDRMMGSGEALEANDRIAALIREVPFPVYVALIAAPEGVPNGSLDSAEALAGLLNRRLGDGLYVVETSDSAQRVLSFGLGADQSRLSLSAYANADIIEDALASLSGGERGTADYVYTPPAVAAEAQVRTAESLLELGRGDYLEGGYPASLTDSEAEELAVRALELDASADWRPRFDDYVSVRTASSGFSALVGVLSALIVGLLAGQTLRGWPRRGKPLPGRDRAQAAAAAPPPDLDVERARARDLVGALVKNLARVDWASVRDRDVADRALTARDAVEPLLESDDVADLVGAQVIAREGSRDLSRGRRGSGAPLATCFFDPRHPDATTVASWRLGDGEVDVPCCVACGTAAVHDGTPDFLRLRTRRGTVPYWERDDVWARTGFGSITDFLARDVLAERAGER